MYATLAGPMGTQQLNQTFFVGVGELATIQAAVDYVRVYNAGKGRIIIPAWHSQSDDISAVTGGAAEIYLTDQRGAQEQNWIWVGSSFIVNTFDQLGNTVTHGEALIGGELHAYGGIDTEIIYVGQTPAEAGAKAMLLGTNPTTNEVQIQGETIGGAFDQTLLLQPSGGDTKIGSIGSLTTVRGSLNIDGIVGTPLHAYGGIDTEIIYVGQTPAEAGAKAMLLGTNPATNEVQIQGQTIGGAFDQTLLLQPGGGDVKIGANAEITEQGSVHAARAKFSGPVRMMNGTEPVGTYNVWTGDGDVGVTGSKGMTITAFASQDLIALQGLTIGTAIGNDIYDQTISLNEAGGDVLVNGSPVRTFANTPSSGGMVYPGTGIGVSTGAAWGTSIDPATLQGKLTLTTNGTSGAATLAGNALNIPQYAGSGGGMVYPATGIPQSTGAAWGTSIDPATLQGKLTLTTTGTSGAATLTGNALNVPQYTAPAQVYPGAGIAVSSGTAWGTPIDPATIPRLTVANTFTSTIKAQSFTANLDPTVEGGMSTQASPNPVTLFGCVNKGSTTIKGGYQFDGYSSDLSKTVTWFRLYEDGTGNHASFSSQVPVSVGNALTVGTTLNVSGVSTLATCVVRNAGQGCTIQMYDTAAGTDNHSWYTEMFNGNQLRMNLVNDALSAATTFFSVTRSGVTATSINLTAGATNVAGNFTVSGGTKAFVIPHPLDDTKDLWHACLEGPENGVFYRGEVVTVDGKAEVTLPDYFEALTFPEDRSVQLTQVFEDGAVLSMLAASRVVNGKFTVYSSAPIATVAWEAKAVRRIGVDKLQVMVEREVPPITDDAPMMPDAPATTAGKPMQPKASKNVH